MIRADHGMKTKVESVVFTFDELLTSDKKFIKSRKRISANCFELPEFQRNFVWGKEQIRRLVYDINSDDNLYLGNIVTSSEKDGFDYLIDGQQRLVTLSLLCFVLSLKTENPEILKEIYQIIFKNKSEPRISFSKINLNSFYKKIVNNKKISSTDPSENFIKRAVSILKTQTKSITSDKEIIFLLGKIKNISFVVIKCLDYSQLSKLFVGLNSTGIELSQTELVKGYLFNKIESIKEKTKANSISKTWKQIEVSFEKKNIFWFNQFLKHQWYLVSGYVTSSKLSSRINDLKIKGSLDVLEDYISTLSTDSKTYINLRANKSSLLEFPKGTRNDSARNIYHILEDIYPFGLQQIYPVVLALYNYGKKNKMFNQNGTSKKIFEKMWAFIILAKYTQLIPSKYEKLFAKFSFDISVRPKGLDFIDYEDFKKIVNKFFEDLSSKVDSSRDKFAKELNDSYKEGEDKFIKILFYDYLDPEYNINYHNLEVEHILPKGADGKGNFKEWSQIPKENYVEMSGCINRLGNLTLLEKKINNTKAKHYNQIKKAEYYKKSFYPDNQNLFDKYSFNTVDDIKKTILETRARDVSSKIFDVYIKRLTEKI